MPIMATCIYMFRHFCTPDRKKRDNSRCFGVTVTRRGAPIHQRRGGALFLPSPPIVCHPCQVFLGKPKNFKLNFLRKPAEFQAQPMPAAPSPPRAARAMPRRSAFFHGEAQKTAVFSPNGQKNERGAVRAEIRADPLRI